MESQIIELLQRIQRSELEEEKSKQIAAQFQNDDNLRKSLFNIVISQGYQTNLKQLAIIFAIRLKIPITTEDLPNFLPLLSNDTFRDLIAELIVISIDPQLVNLTLDGFLNERTPASTIGFIYVSYYLVKIQNTRNDFVIQNLLQIIAEFDNIQIECKKLALETVIKQFLMTCDHLNSDFKAFLSYFVKINVAYNFPLLEYCLKYISDNVYLILQNPNYYNELSIDFSNKINEIFEYFLNKSQIDPDDILSSTILFSLIEVMNDLNIPASFDKLFHFLLYGDKQLFCVINNVDFFYNVFFGRTIDDEDEEEEEDVIKNFWSYYADFRTLNEAQSRIMSFIYSTPQLKKEAIDFCLSNINQGIQLNLAILILVNNGLSEVNFDVSMINHFDNSLLQFVVIDYVIKKIQQNPTVENVYLNFFRSHFNDFASCAVNSGNPIALLSVFYLVQNSPLHIIEPDLFTGVLIGSIKIAFQCFEEIVNKNDFIEQIKNYLTQSACFSFADIVLSNDPKMRRFISKSIFVLPDKFIISLHNNSSDLFSGFFDIFNYCVGNSPLFHLFTEIMNLFAGGNITHFICRDHSNGQFLVDMSDYSVFWPKIIQFSIPLIISLMNDASYVSFAYKLFASVFSVIHCPGDQSYQDFIGLMHNHFINSNYEFFVKLQEIETILRIFIRNGKFEMIKNYCDYFCQHSQIKKFVYEISFILMNPTNFYSDEELKNFSLSLLKMAEQEQYAKSVTCIFARVALHDSQKIVNYLGNELIVFVNNSKINEEYIHSFNSFNELKQRLIIIFYWMFTRDFNVIKALMSDMICNLCDAFEKIEKYHSSFSSFGMMEEDIFYDDLEFLSNQLISCSISDLIRATGTENFFGGFLEKFPNL